MPGMAPLELIAQEWRDPDGYPTVPSELVASTHGRRYSERDFERHFRAYVLEAYRPRLMLVERKIYELKHLVVYGFRRRGRIISEVESWRTHESEWFNAMIGIPLEIDTAEPGGVGEQPPTRTHRLLALGLIRSTPSSTTKMVDRQRGLCARQTWKSEKRSSLRPSAWFVPGTYSRWRRQSSRCGRLRESRVLIR